MCGIVSDPLVSATLRMRGFLVSCKGCSRLCDDVKSKNVFHVPCTRAGRVRVGVGVTSGGPGGVSGRARHHVPRQGWPSRTASRRVLVSREPMSTTTVMSKSQSDTNQAEEAIRYFVKRMEGKGWGDAVRKSVHDGDFSRFWNAMAGIYGLGVVETKLLACPWLVEAIDMFEKKSPVGEVSPHGRGDTRQQATRVWLKMENSQVTGSFKARGAAYKVLKLLSEDGVRHIVVSSTGNHAVAVMHACLALAQSSQESAHVSLDIYVPETIHSRKLAKMEKMAKECNANIVLHGEDCVDAERLARHVAEQTGATYISPYNDLDVISGQGTIAMEILMEKSPEEVDAIFVPVGGGGLISGIAQVMKALAPRVKIVGCQPERSDVMRQSVDEGKIVTIPWLKTLAEGISGGIEDDAVTLSACRDLVDEWVTVTEEEIAAAMVGMHGHHGQQIEGAAAVAIASIMKSKESLMGKHVIGIVCGGNVDAADLDTAYDIVRGIRTGGGEELQKRTVRGGEGKASAF